MTLYEDPEFSCSPIIPPLYSEVVWRRPRHIVRNPKFFGIQCSVLSHNCNEHFERRREVKGRTSTFFLVVVASLTKNIGNFLKVVPEQSFGDDYTGKFRFVFFDHGRQKEVVIDDRLPTSQNGPLLFSDCVEDAFWFPLLEKAYAKFRGGYDKIVTGLPSEAFYHLTGQRAEWFESGIGARLPFTPHGMIRKMNELLERNCLIICKQNDIRGNNEMHGTGFVVIGTWNERRRSNDGVNENRSFVQLRHPSGSIDKSLKDQLCISEVDGREGEGLIDVEKFLNHMQCVYYLEMMDVLRREEGIDPFVPFLPEAPTVNKHRCKKH